MLSEDEPDFTEPSQYKPIKMNQSRNATDYTDEIINDKDPITKLSVETTEDVVGEIRSIEDIPNYENLLLLKLDKVP
jgi:tRNA-binding EMAP/Myf-like protein